MLEGFSLGNYLLLVEYTGRLFREGKAVISAELDGIFERLGSNAENWQARLQKLSAGRLLGRFFAASRARLGSRRAPGRAPPGEPGRLRGAMTPPPRLSTKRVSIRLGITLAPDEPASRPVDVPGTAPDRSPSRTSERGHPERKGPSTVPWSQKVAGPLPRPAAPAVANSLV